MKKSQLLLVKVEKERNQKVLQQKVAMPLPSNSLILMMVVNSLSLLKMPPQSLSLERDFLSISPSLQPSRRSATRQRKWSLSQSGPTQTKSHCPLHSRIPSSVLLPTARRELLLIFTRFGHLKRALLLTKMMLRNCLK